MLAVPCLTPASLAFDDWVTRRDHGVVRQQWDYSCGLASLATLLTHDYQAPVSEAALLERLMERSPRDESALRHTGVSLADLAWLSRGLGFRAAGLALTPSALARLNRPALVYLEQDGMPHFVVLRGLTANGAALIADPSSGNRRMKAETFLRQFVRVPGGGDEDKGENEGKRKGEADSADSGVFKAGKKGRGRLLLLHRPGQEAMLQSSPGVASSDVRLRPPWTTLPPGALYSPGATP